MWLTYLVRGGVLLLLTSFPVSKALCPHEESGLSTWSSSVTADSDGVVSITSAILLDATPSSSYNGIIINSGGKLVFKPDITDGLGLTTKYIRINNNGEMHIGDETASCRYTGDLKITLTGDRDEEDLDTTFGNKFIGVASGGTIEVHGEDRMAWTKLDGTLSAMAAAGSVYTDEVSAEDDVDGVVVWNFDPDSPSTTVRGVFKLRMGTTQAQLDSKIDDFDDFVSAISTGNMVAIGIRKSLMQNGDTRDYSEFYDKLETYAYGEITDSSQVRDLEFYDGFAIIFERGADPAVAVEAYAPYKQDGLHQYSTATLVHGDNKYQVVSYTRSVGFAQSYVSFEVTDKTYSLPILTLVDSAADWRTGDEVLIASTDFDYEEMEFGNIIDCASCSANQIQLDLTVQHNHFGKVINGVDMRAEVALTTRNVKFEGDTYGDDQLGGHLRILSGFTAAHIEGAEFIRMGAHFPLGRYPIHWHLTGNSTGSYAKQNSIHHSYARACTIHGAQNVLLEDNVAYNILGHAYFMEDGDEYDNTLKRNFVTGTVKAPSNLNSTHLINTDNKPSGFWITNPDNILQNNVAAGGEGHGIWYVSPEYPMGPSASRTSLENGQAQHTTMTDCTNNVAHSNAKTGFRVQELLASNGSTTWNNKYQATVDPTDLNSAAATVVITKATAYKNGEHNILISASKLQLDHASVSDGNIGIQLVKPDSNDMETQELINSVILGESSNDGSSRPDEDLFGLMIGEGPVSVDNVYFDGFDSSASYTSGAIAFEGGKPTPLTTLNTIENAAFGFADPTDGNRVYAYPVGTADYNSTADELESFEDVDGTVTDSSDQVTVLRESTLQYTDNCDRRTNWGSLAICDEVYGQIKIVDSSQVWRVTHESDMTKNISVPATQRFNVPLDTSDFFFIHLDDAVNWDHTVNAQFFDMNGHRFNMAVCVPTGATFKVKYAAEGNTAAVTLTASSSFANWKTNAAGAADEYFYDSTIGVLFVGPYDAATGTDGKYCSDDDKGLCRKLTIKMLSGTTTENNDCLASAAAEYLPAPGKRTLGGAGNLKDMKSVRNLLDLLKQMLTKDRKRIASTKLKRRSRVRRGTSTAIFPADSFPANDIGAGETNTTPT